MEETSAICRQRSLFNEDAMWIGAGNLNSQHPMRPVKRERERQRETHTHNIALDSWWRIAGLPLLGRAEPGAGGGVRGRRDIVEYAACPNAVQCLATEVVPLHPEPGHGGGDLRWGRGAFSGVENRRPGGPRWKLSWPRGGGGGFARTIPVCPIFSVRLRRGSRSATRSEIGRLRSQNGSDRRAGDWQVSSPAAGAGGGGPWAAAAAAGATAQSTMPPKSAIISTPQLEKG